MLQQRVVGEVVSVESARVELPGGPVAAAQHHGVRGFEVPSGQKAFDFLGYRGESVKAYVLEGLYGLVVLTDFDIDRPQGLAAAEIGRPYAKACGIPAGGGGNGVFVPIDLLFAVFPAGAFHGVLTVRKVGKVDAQLVEGIVALLGVGQGIFPNGLVLPGFFLHYLDADAFQVPQGEVQRAVLYLRLDFGIVQPGDQLPGHDAAFSDGLLATAESFPFILQRGAFFAHGLEVGGSAVLILRQLGEFFGKEVFPGQKSRRLAGMAGCEVFKE